MSTGDVPLPDPGMRTTAALQVNGEPSNHGGAMRQPQPSGRSSRKLPGRSSPDARLGCRRNSKDAIKDRGNVVRTTTASRDQVGVKPVAMLVHCFGNEPNRMEPLGSGFGAYDQVMHPAWSPRHGYALQHCLTQARHRSPFGMVTSSSPCLSGCAAFAMARRKAFASLA